MIEIYIKTENIELTAKYVPVKDYDTSSFMSSIEIALREATKANNELKNKDNVRR